MCIDMKDTHNLVISSKKQVTNTVCCDSAYVNVFIYI